MNEIKFRGKSINTLEYVYGFLYIQEPPLHCFKLDKVETPTYYIIKTGFADWNMTRPVESHEVYPLTVGQYTNFKDSNMLEIYDKSIIKVEAHIHDCNSIPELAYEVRMLSGQWYCTVINEPDDLDFSGNDSLYNMIRNFHCEVVE